MRHIQYVPYGVEEKSHKKRIEKTGKYSIYLDNINICGEAYEVLCDLVINEKQKGHNIIRLYDLLAHMFWIIDSNTPKDYGWVLDKDSNIDSVVEGYRHTIDGYCLTFTNIKKLSKEQVAFADGYNKGYKNALMDTKGIIHTEPSVSSINDILDKILKGDYKE